MIIQKAKEYFRHIKSLYATHISAGLEKAKSMLGYAAVEKTGKGSRLTTHDGQVYLDFNACFGTLAFGHLHPYIVDKVREQLEIIAISPKVFLNADETMLGKELSALTNNRCQNVYFTNSGSEAVEDAIKTARAATGKPVIIYMSRAFHGRSMCCLSACNERKYKLPFEPLVPGFEVVLLNDCSALTNAIGNGEQIAAVIMEPIQAEGGIYPATVEFMQHARELCTKKKVLLIFDEVQTGLGRTGKMFGYQHYGVEPDIIALAKALSGGIVPIGATLTTSVVHEQAYGGDKSLSHSNTFGGNHLACAAGLAALQVIKDEGLVEHVQLVGEYLKKQIELLAARYPDLISEVRGFGLLLGMEFYDVGNAGKVIREMLKQFIIVVYTLNRPCVIRIEPPLNISMEEIGIFLAALAISLEAAEKLRLHQLAKV